MPRQPSLAGQRDGLRCNRSTAHLAAASAGDQYDMQIGLSCGNGPIITTSLTSWSVFDLAPGMTYLWRVRTRSQCGGTSSWSNCSSSDCLPIHGPDHGGQPPERGPLPADLLPDPGLGSAAVGRYLRPAVEPLWLLRGVDHHGHHGVATHGLRAPAEHHLLLACAGAHGSARPRTGAPCPASAGPSRPRPAASLRRSSWARETALRVARPTRF